MKTPIFDKKIIEKLKLVEYLLLDMDGVMTNGAMGIASDGGDISFGRNFYCLDGYGVELLKKHTSLKVIAISATDRPIILQARARQIKIDKILDNGANKLATYTNFIESEGIDATKIAYVGDEMNDSPMIGRVGLFFAPCSAHYYVKAKADFVLQNAGGEGAVRELCDMILYARGKFEEVYSDYSIQLV